jgi:DNA-binding beta-propeller fold protein YncE
MRKRVMVFVLPTLILATTALAEDPPVFLLKWGSFGAQDGEFTYAADIAVIPNGDVYVTDWNERRIQVFDGTGTFLRKWGLGLGPFGVADDPSGNVYITETTRSPRWVTIACRSSTATGPF